MQQGFTHEGASARCPNSLKITGSQMDQGFVPERSGPEHRLTRHGMQQLIERGQGVLYRGDIIDCAEKLPSEEELALGRIDSLEDCSVEGLGRWCIAHAQKLKAELARDPDLGTRSWNLAPAFVKEASRLACELELAGALKGVDTSQIRPDKTDIDPFVAVQKLLEFAAQCRPSSSGNARAKGNRGRKPDTDRNADKHIYDAWKEGHYRTYDECARDLGRSRDVVKLAVDRHRKRQ